jgi:DNA polymerase III alpha subunit (gram-positive type)
MNLNDLNKKSYAVKALKENFSMDFNVEKLDKIKTKTMLNKVARLIKEARQTPQFQSNQTNPSYLKLIFMEQALSSHYSKLSHKTSPRIVFENEEVEKSQVILAAQDMVDSVQKMIEQVSDMLVKELPALSDSIQSEIGVNESQQFNSQVSQALSTLNATLQQSKTTLQGALGTITGQGMSDFGSENPSAGMPDLGDDAELGDMDDNEMDSEMPKNPTDDFSDEEDDIVGSVGRSRR